MAKSEMRDLTPAYYEELERSSSIALDAALALVMPFVWAIVDTVLVLGLMARRIRILDAACIRIDQAMTSPTGRVVCYSQDSCLLLDGKEDPDLQ